MQRGQLVKFHYLPSDWEWMRAGPLGMPVPVTTLSRSHLQPAWVMETKSGYLDQHYFTQQGRECVLLRFCETLGQGYQEEYDPERLLAEGWNGPDWPTEFAAPVSALTAL